MKQITLAQINPTVGALENNLDLVRRVRDGAGEGIVVFPELSVCGYPPEDLLLKSSFLDRIDGIVDTLVRESAGGKTILALPAPWRHEGKLHNAMHVIGGGRIIKTVCKHRLPNYGVFDECRWFAPGSLPDPVVIDGVSYGFMICEDMWHPDAAAHLKKKGAAVLIVANASPFETGKHDLRMAQAQGRVRETGLPLFYVNQTGGQDDLVFDGGSFALDERGAVSFQAPFFEEWAGAPLAGHKESGALDETEIRYSALKLGLHDYVRKNGFSGVLLGLSGGIDSALCAAITADALEPRNVRCVMMPSPFTSQGSIEDAAECARLLGVSYETIPISGAMEAFETALPDLSGLAHENMQARARGIILMSLSNATDAMVLSTGNKSEYAAGYATLYGDMCGGYALLKDVYKTQVYELARWRNAQGRVIPERILTKAPTAELKPNQTDQDTLPPYDVLDAILHCLIERDLRVEETVAQGYEIETVRRVMRMLDRAEYKRRQSPPGPKISTRAFARERRWPMTNGFKG